MKVKKIITSITELDLDITGATLLTIKEAEKLPKRLRKYNELRWWWLRSPGYYYRHVAVVDIDGSIYDYGSYVSCDRIAVRPVLTISNFKSSDLKIGDIFEFGGKQFEIISNDKAFCLTAIGEYAFRNDWEAQDADDYEKSDVKQFIDKWFKENINEEVNKKN